MVLFWCYNAGYALWAGLVGLLCGGGADCLVCDLVWWICLGFGVFCGLGNITSQG